MAQAKTGGGKKGGSAAEKEKKELAPITGADATINALRKLGVSVRASSDASEILGWITSGNYALNWAMSGRFYRGYPYGRSVELYGDPATGKSFLIQWLIAAAQAMGGLAYLDDTENAFNSKWARNSVGVLDDRLAYQDPRSETVNDHLSNMLAFMTAVSDLIKKKIIAPTAPVVGALDSLGHLTTEHERDKLYVKDMQRVQEIHKLHRVIGSPLSYLPMVYVIANHKVASIDQFTESDSGGGKGTKFAASIRLNMMRPRRMKDAKSAEFTGVISTVVVSKNRIVPPWREIEIAIPFYRPANPASGLIPVLERAGFIEFTSGHTIAYEDKDTRLPAAKTDFLKQDDSAVALLNMFPDLLTKADAFFDATEGVYDPEAAASLVEDDS